MYHLAQDQGVCSENINHTVALTKGFFSTASHRTVSDCPELYHILFMGKGWDDHQINHIARIDKGNICVF